MSKLTSEKLLESQTIIGQLIQVFDELDTYVGDHYLWDEALIQSIHIKRQKLTTALYKVLPMPLPLELQDLVMNLHERTKVSLARMAASQQETRDAVLTLQNYRKAKNAYQAL